MNSSCGKELDKCSLCGLCKYSCPVFRIMLKETVSPRGKAVLLKKGLTDKYMFYQCTLCNACENSCPAEVKLGLREAREKLVSSGKETESNKKMIANVRRYGNPFGKPGKKPKDLYCC